MATDKKIVCPFTQTSCIEDGSIVNGELVQCRFWVKVAGKDPQTGKDIDSSDCAINWMPVLLIENSKINRETGAAIESFRNKMVEAVDSNNRLRQVKEVTHEINNY